MLLEPCSGREAMLEVHIANRIIPANLQFRTLVLTLPQAKPSLRWVTSFLCGSVESNPLAPLGIFNFNFILNKNSNFIDWLSITYVASTVTSLPFNNSLNLFFTTSSFVLHHSMSFTKSQCIR